MSTAIKLDANFIATTSCVRAALAARSSWLSQQDRTSAKAVFQGNRQAKYSWTDSASAEVAAKVIIPADVMLALLARIDKICTEFCEMFDEQCIGVKYGDDDITAACQALPAALVREQNRICSLNGVVPAPHLDTLFERAKHIAVHL